MKLFNLLSVRAKLASAFACVLAIMLCLAGFSAWQMQRMDARTDDIMTYRLTGLRDSGHMLEWVPRLRTRELALPHATADKVPVIVERIRASQAEFAKHSKSYAGAIANAEEQALFDQAQASWNAYITTDEALIQAAQAGKPEDAWAVIDGSGKLFEAALNAVRELGHYNERMAEKDAALAKAAYHDSLKGMVALIFAAVVMATALGMLLVAAIARPLRGAVDLAKAVAGGDLNVTLTTSEQAGNDEVGQLTSALGQMVTCLRQVVGSVRTGVDSVTLASTEIAAGNLDLSQRTEEQASNLQQTAASMEQLTATVRQNADSARTAAEQAEQASQVAVQGGEVVAGVITTMTDITNASKRVFDIISVIDGIAFQTNILALNAAVEAARAGEQGRGFAVVAAEVRSLAQRSAQAAKEVKTLIEANVNSVGHGSRQVAEAGDTMNQIISRVRSVSALIEGITTASSEQAKGIDQVGSAVAQLDQVTQQNAALVEESAAAAESLKHQANHLSSTMAVFRLT
jgi:methyl-accepting chemotaxis protein